MNIPEYISSGVLEDYSLGVLSKEEQVEVEKVCAQYPEVKQELINIQKALEQHIVEQPVWRKAALKDKIWEKLSNLATEEAATPGNFPVINKYSDHNNWLKIVKPFIPANFTEGMYTRVINHRDNVTHILMMSYIDHEEEVHDDLNESFMILEGECVCDIDGKTTRLKAGDYLEIPLYAKHNVKVLSPYVLAVVQRIAV